MMSHGMEEVGLAEPGVAVDEQRVVVAAGLFGDRHRRRIWEPVGGSDDEVFERVAGDQP